jgi:beta-1,2-mannosidase
MQTRPLHFDSDLDECGPPALVTDRGVMLIYNGKNANSKNADPSLPKGTYSVGTAFFDPQNLQTILSRSDSPFLKPTLPHEVSGQYAAGTTFAEGLVYYSGKWFLYYGTADSYVGVAISR